MGRELSSNQSALTWKFSCKNPGHQSFIPAPQFSISHLPAWAQRQSIWGYIQNLAARTVKLSVSQTSKSRLLGFPLSNNAMPGATTTGSGWVHWITPGDGCCPCAECDGNQARAKPWWKVAVETACHVVFDAEEARCTQVLAFYNDELSFSNGRTKMMHGVEMYDRDEKLDRSWLWCATHDESLVQELMNHLTQRDMLKRILEEEQGHDTKDLLSLCVVVSHPHGQPKQVTVGELEQSMTLKGVDNRSHTWTCTTDTCAGSSGGPVFVLVPECASHNLTRWTMGLAPHSKECLEGGLNQSGVGNISWH